MQRKTVMLMLASVMALSMTGCGLGATQAPETNTETAGASEGAGDSAASETPEAGGETGVYTNSTQTQGKTNEIVIKVSNGSSESHPTIQAQLNTFAPEIEEATGGRVGVEIYAGGQLGDDTTATEMVIAGQLECYNTSTAPLVSYVPELAMFDIPFLFEDEAEADYVLDSEVTEYLNKKLEEKGLVCVSWNENGFRELTNSKRAVESVDDVKGLKIRTMENEFHQALWNSLGASAVPMSSNELYTALEQGTVDGEENPVPNFYAYQFHEVQDYVTITNHIYSPDLLIFSKKIWDTYDADVQEAIRAAAEHYTTEERRLNREAIDEDLKLCEEGGMEVTRLTPEAKQAFVDATIHIRDSIAETTGPEIMELLDKAGAK